MDMTSIEIDLEVYKALEQRRQSLSENHNAILRRVLLDDRLSASTSGQNSHEKSMKTGSPISIGQRMTGNWSVKLMDTVYPARNLKEAYITALVKIEDTRPGFLASLTGENIRSRRMVASEPERLYESSPHLAEPGRNNFYVHDGWYIDHNLSQNQAASRIRRAAAIAGLRYGSDVAIRKNLEVI